MVGVDNKPVNGVRDLLEMISLRQPGDVIEINVYRGSDQLTFKLEATERPG